MLWGVFAEDRAAFIASLDDYSLLVIDDISGRKEPGQPKRRRRRLTRLPTLCGFISARPAGKP